nr:ABC transporter substrate-binding protein [Streptomyces boncukensis]
MPLAALAPACSALPGKSGGAERSLVVGTTSAPSALDPAAAWDGSWELFRNIYQTLLTVPNPGSPPKPDAAERCRFTDGDSRVYRCRLREGLTFTSGNAVTARAVKYALDRTVAIDSKAGPASLLASLDRVEVQGERTLVFHLKEPDATFPYVLTTPAASLVDPAAYPGTRVRSQPGAVGSGPYRLAGYAHGERARLVRNPDYRGAAEIKNDSVTIRYFSRSSRMAAALRNGRIDLVYRGLTQPQITAFQAARSESEHGVELHEMTGSEIHYLVFNPRDRAVRDPAVREAVARVIDRKALVRRVYAGTAEPLYSMVPTGIAGHTNAFYNKYGEPDPDRARAVLARAGIRQKVKLTLWYADDRYGEAAAREFAEIRRQLNASGLFDTTVRGRDWSTFQAGFLRGAYPVFGRGWSADFPDADNYLTPFVGAQNAMGTPYVNREITERLLPRSREMSDRARAGRPLARAQRLIADDVRLLPLWQGKIQIAARKDVAGVEWALDPSSIMRMWQLHKKTSW